MEQLNKTYLRHGVSKRNNCMTASSPISQAQWRSLELTDFHNSGENLDLIGGCLPKANEAGMIGRIDDDSGMRRWGFNEVIGNERGKQKSWSSQERETRAKESQMLERDISRHNFFFQYGSTVVSTVLPISVHGCVLERSQIRRLQSKQLSQ